MPDRNLEKSCNKVRFTKRTEQPQNARGKTRAGPDWAAFHRWESSSNARRYARMTFRQKLAVYDRMREIAVKLSPTYGKRQKKLRTEKDAWPHLKHLIELRKVMNKLVC